MTFPSRSLLLMICAAWLLTACADKVPSSKAGDSAQPSAAAMEGIDAHVAAQAGQAAGLPVRGSLQAVWEGEERQWNITTLADTSRMSAGMVSDEGFSLGVNLRGQTHAPFESSLVLEVSYPGKTISLQATPSNSSLTLIPHAGIAPPHWNAQDDLVVTLTRAEYDGQSGRIEGTFSGTLCYRAGMYDPPDPGNCRPIEGRFASDLEREVF